MVGRWGICVSSWESTWIHALNINLTSTVTRIPTPMSLLVRNEGLVLTSSLRIILIVSGVFPPLIKKSIPVRSVVIARVIGNNRFSRSPRPLVHPNRPKEGNEEKRHLESVWLWGCAGLDQQSLSSVAHPFLELTMVGLDWIRAMEINPMWKHR